MFLEFSSIVLVLGGNNLKFLVLVEIFRICYLCSSFSIWFDFLSDFQVSIDIQILLGFSILSIIVNMLVKRGYQIGHTKINLGGDSPVFEIESWNFQQMLDLRFSETSQNFSSFRQLFFHSFQGGTKGKKLKNQCKVSAIFQHFFFGPPLETLKKKVV